MTMLHMQKAIVLDCSGNIYVTGGSAGSGTLQDDYATIKYNSAGHQQWAARYNGPRNGGDRANAIAIDPAGHVCVTGFSTDPQTDVDCATIKYRLSRRKTRMGRPLQWVR